MTLVAETNPLLPLAVFAVAYLLWRLLAGNLATALWGLLALFLLLGLVLPGGRILAERTAELPEIGMRTHCLGAALMGGAPFTRAAERVPECRYRSPGFSRPR